MENEVLIKVEVDQSAALADLRQTEDSITDIQNAQAQLNQSVKEGKITSDQYKSSRQALDNQMTVAKTSHKNLTDSLNANNKQLGDGAVKTQGLGKELTGLGKNVTDTKKATDSFGVGLDSYAKGLDQFGIGASGAIDQVKGLTKASLQFLATPVGAVLGAIVLALGSLASYFKNTGDGADKFARIMAQLGAAMDVVIDRVSNFGRGLLDLFTGDVEAGLFQMSQSFKGVADEMANEVVKAGEIADALDELGDAEREYQVKASETRNEIRLLEIQAKDRTKTEGERAELLRLAMDKEIQLSKDLTDIRRGQLQAAVDEAASRANLQQRNNESLEDFAKRLVANGQLTDELRDNVANGIKALNEAEGESLTHQEKLQTKRNELLEKQEKRQQETLDKELKALQQQSKDMRDEYQKQYDEKQTIARQEELETEKRHERAAESFAATQAYMSTLMETNENWRTKLRELGVKARELWDNEEFQKFRQSLEGSMQFVEFVYEQSIADREAQAKEQIEILTLQTQAEKAIREQQYEDDLASLEERFRGGELSQEQYNDARKKLEDDYKSYEVYLQDQLAYEKDQIAKKAFEDNKKIRVADSIIDAIQASLAAFRSFAPIPFVGVPLGLAAAATALKFGMDNVERIRNQQYVGSGAPPQPPPAGGVPEIEFPPPSASPDVGRDIDGGGVSNELGGGFQGKFQQNIVVVASLQEWTDLQQRVEFKENLSEA